MNPQHIIGFQAENIKRITAVKMEFDKDNPSGSIIVTGENGAGKSSVLDALCMALGGASWAAQETVRKGHGKARVVATTEDLVITRRFVGENSYLEVTNREGLVYQKPQDMLRKFIAAVALDPIQFLAMKAEEQATLLMRLCPPPINLDEHQVKHDEEYDRRRDLSRDLRAAEAHLRCLSEPPKDIPNEPVSVADMFAQISKLRNEQATAMAQAREADNLDGEICVAENAVKEFADRLERAQHGLQVKKDARAKMVVTDGAPGLARLVELEKTVQDTEKTNAAVRAKTAYLVAVEAVKALAAQVAKSEQALAALDGAKADAFRKTTFPIPALAVNDAGQLTYKELPLSQASQSEKIRVGLGMVAAANPTLKVAFIRDGSLLDAKSMAEIAEVAKNHNLQVWIERVEDKTPSAVRIIDGSNIGALDVPDPIEIEAEENVADPAVVTGPGAKRKRGRPSKSKPGNLFQGPAEEEL